MDMRTVVASNIVLDARINAIQPQEYLNMKEQDKRFLAGTRYNVLRSGTSAFAGMAGEQSGISYRNVDHHAFLFVAQSYRDDPGFTRPGINLRLRGGGVMMKAFDPANPLDLVRQGSRQDLGRHLVFRAPALPCRRTQAAHGV